MWYSAAQFRRYPEIPGIETMIGLLINTLPTRVRLRSGDSFGELVAA